MVADIDSSLHAKHSLRILSHGAIAYLVEALDACVVFSTGLAIYLIYVGDRASSASMYIATLIITSYLTVQVLRWAKLYNFDRILYPANRLGSLFGACTVVFLLMLTLAYGLKISAEFSRVWAVSWWLLSIVLLTLARMGLASLLPELGKRGVLTRRLVVYGAGEDGQHFMSQLAQLDEPWNRVVGVFDDRATRIETDGELVNGNLDALLQAAREHRADEVIVALPWNESSDRIAHILRRLSVLPANVRLCISPQMARYLSGGIDSQFGVPVASVFFRPITGGAAFAKRCFDVVVGLSILVLAAPLMLLIAIAIKLDSPGPVFFRQQRYGFNDELISVLKFRTMQHAMTDAAAERLATRNDPRVTRVGYLLRRLSLDELPQLLNVVAGNMSLVGPRPHATRAKAGTRLYQDVVEHYSSRHRVKPGLTGWAQINGWRGETDTDEKIIKRIEYDLYYISHWSLWLDIKILCATLKVVFDRDNAY